MRFKALQTAQALRDLLGLIEHETDLPRSAANGVTDPTGSIDEGEVRAAQIIENARAVLADLNPPHPNPSFEQVHQRLIKRLTDLAGRDVAVHGAMALVRQDVCTLEEAMVMAIERLSEANESLIEQCIGLMREVGAPEIVRLSEGRE